MLVAKITSKGQLTLPKKIREKLGVRPGEVVGFEEKDGRISISKIVRTSPFDKWVGKLGHLAGRQSDELVKELRGH